MTGRDRQTVADAAVERCGSAEALFGIARHKRRTAEYIQGQGFSPANIYECEPDVLTNDPTDASRMENVVTESDETIIQ